MKKYIFKYGLFLFLFAALVGCEEDVIIYDAENSQAFVKFESTSSTLPIPFSESISIEIPISVSTKSSSERRVTVSVVEEETTLDQSNFTFSSEVTIPANEFTGNLVITGTNSNLELGVVETIVFKLDGLSAGDSNIDSSTLRVDAFLNCPYDINSFVGTYLANEDGYCDGCYEVEVTLGSEPNTLVLSNLWDVGGTTTITLDPSNDNHIDFTFGEFLYVNPTYGDARTYNPSAVSGNTADDISTFRTCDNYMDLYFRVCVDAGCFGLVHIQLTKKN